MSVTVRQARAPVSAQLEFEAFKPLRRMCCELHEPSILD